MKGAAFLVLCLVPVLQGSEDGEFQRYDGWFNNLNRINYGSYQSKLVYLSPPAYSDGVYGVEKGGPDAGQVSAELFRGPDGIRSPDRLNMFFVTFGQLVSGEIMATTSSGNTACPAEKMKIHTFQDKNCRRNGTVLECETEKAHKVPVFRVAYDQNTGRHLSNPRRPLNFATSWIDGSFVYSSSWMLVDSLRAWDGSGELKSRGLDPVMNDMAAPLLNPPPPVLHPKLAPTERQYLVGSGKANQEPGILAASFVLHRWHNHWARHFRHLNPSWSEERLFQTARRWVIASLQQITMYEYVPLLLGEEVGEYEGYKEEVDPGISAEFQGAAYRWGHSLVPSGFFLTAPNCTATPHPFCSVWWNSQKVIHDWGLESILRGLLTQEAEKGDHVFSLGMREQMFGGLTASETDLAGLNIQRGRDEGLASFNTVRRSLNLSAIKDWPSLNPVLWKAQPKLLERAQKLYGNSTEKLDLFVGGLLESQANGRPGPTFKAIIRDQFIRLRDGDRFWFENTKNGFFNEKDLRFLRGLTLSGILEKVTNLTEDEIGAEAMRADSPRKCKQPYQLTISRLSTAECADGPRHYDFFVGSAWPFALSFAILALFPLLVAGVAWAMATHRKAGGSGCWSWRLGRKKEERKRVQRVPTGRERSRFGTARRSQGIFSAWEWNGESSKTGTRITRDAPPPKARVRVEVKPGPVLITSTSETNRRVVDLSALSERLDIRISEDEPSQDYVFQMAVPKSYDMILLFDSSSVRSDFVAHVEAEFLSSGKEWRVGYLPRAEIMRSAVTMAHREELLTDFFTTAFHQVHRAQEKKRGRHLNGGSGAGEGKNLGRARLAQSRIAATLGALTGAASRASPLHRQSTGAARRRQEDEDPTSPRRLLRRALISIELSKMEFAKAMQLKSDSVFVEQMFRLADKDRNGTISYPEFIDVLALFSKGSLESKMRMLFDMYDLDGSGDMDQEEFAIMIRSLLDVTGKAGSKVCAEDVEQMTLAMLRDCGLEIKARLSFGDFFHVINTHRDLIWTKETAESFGVTNTERKLSVDGRSDLKDANLVLEEKEEDHSSTASFAALNRRFRRLARSVENNWNQILMVFFYLSISGILFAYKFVQYQFYNEHKGTRQVVGIGASFSRGSAHVLSFSFALLLLTVCRNLLGVVRSSSLGYYLPVDSSLTAHRWLAAMIALMSVIHIVGHGINFYQVATQPPTILACLFPDVWLPPDRLLKFQFWLFETVPGVTGVLLVLAMSVMYVFASSAARRTVFPAFWTTHRLFPFVYFLLFLHGSRGFLQPPSFHLFMAVPLALFILDWIIRLRRHALSLSIANAEPLPSGVLHLSLKKPRSLSYKSGQWVRIACDTLSDQEFHPFTITSAPHERTLDVYIRSAGPWTKRMYALFSDPLTLSDPMATPRIILEGPYGSSHQEWFKFKAVVLVGAGIGVTPHASVLKDLVHKVYNQKSDIATRHVYFVWLSRGQQQFEWLLEVLRELEELDRDGIVSVDIFVTQLLKDYDIRTMMLYMCEHQFQRLSGRSLFTGIRGRTHFGRIDLEAYLHAIQRTHAGMSKVGVFSCGPKSVVRSVDATCSRLNRTSVKPQLVAYHEIF